MIVAKPSRLPSFPASALNIVLPVVPSSAVSSRRPLLAHVSTMRLNSRRLTLLQTLCRREKRQLLYNQTNPHSFAKTPGVGHTPKSLTCGIRNLQTLRSRASCNLVNASRPLFSWSCKSLFPQPLLIHIYTKPRGSGTRRAVSGVKSKDAWRRWSRGGRSRRIRQGRRRRSSTRHHCVG